MASINLQTQHPAQHSRHTVTALDAVATAVSRLAYGTVELKIHDGRVVQLEVTERQRFE